ncbi:MAG: serine kinase [Lysobacterales bacterium]|nr:MAG: serine kinase [Xanthomonadales bacterium]
MKHVAAADPASDPFGERYACPLRTRARVLGGVFEFESNSRPLLRLVNVAFADLPPHSFRAAPPQFRIRLVLTSAEAPLAGDEVPRMRLHSGAGLLCGTMDCANFAVVSPTERTGLVVVSRNMLRHPYHIRYELIEFAVYTLASRAQQLVSLHAACIGGNECGLLLIGPSGAGKSTLSLHCLMRDMELVAEDGVLVAPDTLLATGVGSFLHLSADSLAFLRDAGDDAWIRKSPVIRRRSGVEKFEVDLRRGRYHIARTPLKVVAVVFLSKQRASRRSDLRPLLRPLRKAELVEKLQASQPYAVNQPGWATFRRRLSRISAFELRRGRHPDEAVNALRGIIE